MRTPVNDRNAVSETLPLIEIAPGGIAALGVAVVAVGEGDVGATHPEEQAPNVTLMIAIKAGAGKLRI